MRPPIQQLHEIIIDGKNPTLFVDFGKFSVEFSLNHYENFSLSLEKNIEILEKCLEIDNIPGSLCVRKLPRPLFDILFRIYADFQYKTSTQLFESIPEYVKTDESRSQWLLAKAAGIFNVLPTVNGKLTRLQRTWVIYNAAQDKIEQNTTITNIIDTLKPWLDKELYARIQEYNANTRENVMFDDSEEIIDAQIRENASKAVRSSREDLGDTIRIKDTL